MKFDLIKGKSGTVNYTVIDGGNSDIVDTYEAKITRKFNPKGTGLTLTKVTTTDFDEETGDPLEVEVTPTDADKEMVCYTMGLAFKKYQTIVNKAGTTMKSIGFSKL